MSREISSGALMAGQSVRVHWVYDRKIADASLTVEGVVRHVDGIVVAEVTG